EVTGAVEAAEARLVELEAGVAAAGTERDALAARLAELEESVAEATAGQAAAVAVAAPEAAGGAGRAAAAVQAAVATAPGLAEASAAERAALVTALEGGACVTDALAGALGEINRQTAAALMRGLGGC
ncbi:MAG TPA: hypothetical protein PK452_17490, partial [Amaricoccus sp.]|nr:hypothetical protein [Amaricoccus sp.]